MNKKAAIQTAKDISLMLAIIIGFTLMMAGAFYIYEGLPAIILLSAVFGAGIYSVYAYNVEEIEDREKDCENE